MSMKMTVGVLIGAAGLVLAAVSPVAAVSPDLAPNPHVLSTAGAGHSGVNASTSPPPLSYHGGVADGAAGTVGVETTPRVYVVFWGSQWNNNDPSGEAKYLQNFLGGLYQSSATPDTWSTSTTQYCQTVTVGATSCPAPGIAAPATSPLAGVWSDNGSSAPSRPRQSDLANEAIKAATHFGLTTAVSNASVQYVIATAHRNSSRGFGLQYCAWHSSVSSSYGDLAYTNFPYQTDAGASCGQNFVNSGAAGLLDGVSIVGGHEYAETITDQFPNGGWLDANGAENGDKCAWGSPGTPGGAANITLSTGTFAVQSLWSNSFNNNAGGCVISFNPSTGAQSQ